LGLPGARKWRQVWSDHQRRDEPPRRVMEHALAAAAQAAVALA
jgi:tRNA-dihydrouridine synthase A